MISKVEIKIYRKPAVAFEGVDERKEVKFCVLVLSTILGIERKESNMSFGLVGLS